MTKKTLLAILVPVILLTLLNSATLFFAYRENKKTVVIDIMKTVNEFRLKKDLEGRVAIKLNRMSSDIDSLRAVYKALVGSHADEAQISGAATALDTFQARAQRAYLVSNKTINEQVWTRLNTLINDYGDKYGYTLVIGANGMGTVLYNKKEIDKTDELIKFINDKYETGH